MYFSNYIKLNLSILYNVPKISSYNFSTIPEAFTKTYGKSSGLLVALIVVFLLSPAPYLKILSIIIEHTYSIGAFDAIAISALVSMLYTIKGGFGSVLGTDKFQFILMYLGFFLVLFYLYMNYGGYNFLYSNLPAQKLSIPGDLNWSYIFVWGFIAMITFIDPNFYHRTFSGASKNIIQKGIYASVGLWFLFDFMSISLGLYSAAIIPNIQSSPYLDLASSVLPPFLRAVFIVSMLSVVMSTIDSFIFLSGVTIGKDVIGQITNKYENDVHYTKIGIAITAAISVILATFFENALDMWYVIGSFGVSTVFIPLLCIFYNQRLQYPFLVIALPLVVTFFWFIFSPYDLDLMYPGLLSSVICLLLLRK